MARFLLALLVALNIYTFINVNNMAKKEIYTSLASIPHYISTTIDSFSKSWEIAQTQRP
jgi:hypothetical protein